MDSNLSVLLRDVAHDASGVKLALKVEQLSISISRTPIQIPVPGGEPELIDLGFNRPSITLSGVVDNIGGNPANTTWDSNTKHKGQELLSIGGQDYYIPYKNYLEEKLITWVISTSVVLQLEIGDATTPIATSGALATGGGIYEVAVQQMQFALAPGMEDRWMYTIGFVAKTRNGISF